MTPEHAILLHPGCPAPDDPEIGQLLDILATLAGARWVELDLRAEDTRQHHTYSTGTRNTDGNTLSLQIGRLFTATVHLGTDSPLDAAFARHTSFLIGKTLQSTLLERQLGLLRAALDTTHSAVLLFSSGGDIVFANPPADRLLSQQTKDGLLVVRGGIQGQPLFTLMCSLVEEVVSDPGPGEPRNGVVALSDGSALAWEILRVDLSREPGERGALALLQTVDAIPSRRLDRFVADHGLSRREEQVAGKVLAGLPTDQIAARLGISPHTVRDHLKRIYRKTGSRSRNELLSMLTAAASPMPPRL